MPTYQILRTDGQQATIEAANLAEAEAVAQRPELPRIVVYSVFEIRDGVRVAVAHGVVP